MTKQDRKMKSSKLRYFTLSNLKELRYYENDKELNKNTYRRTIDLHTVRVLRNYENVRVLELLTNDRTYIFMNKEDHEHIEWLNSLENVLKGSKNCCYCRHKNQCDILQYDENSKNSVYYKMDSLHEGTLRTFHALDDDNIENGGVWKQNYYAIDGRTMRLFYTKDVETMVSFQSALIAKDYYEKYICEQMDGYYLLFGQRIEIIDSNEEHLGDNMWDEPGNKSFDASVGECDANDLRGPGFYVTDDEDDEIKDDAVEMYDKFEYKFAIEDDVFGVASFQEAKMWVSALKNAIDFSMREIYNYDDEKHYLCRSHLNLLVCRFYFDKRDVSDDDEGIPFGAYRYIIKCIGTECWNSSDLVSF